MWLISPTPGDDAGQGKLERLSVAIGVGIALCGALVLYGWSADIEAIKRISPGFPSMNPMTASGFVILGLSLALQYRPLGAAVSRISGVLRLVSKASLIAVLIFASLVLVGDYLNGVPQVDQFLFTDNLTDTGTGMHSSTAPGTALCLLLGSGSLLSLNVTTKRGFRPAEVTAIAMGYTSFFGIEQYLFGIGSHYSAEIFSSMALHSALSAQLVAFGILFSRPRQGLMALTTSNYPGAIILSWGYPLIAFAELATSLFRFEAEAQGVFSESFSVAIFTLINLGIIGVLLLLAASVMRRSELRRQRSEDERNRFFNLSLDLMCIANPDGYFTHVNAAFLTTLGYSEAELLSRPFYYIVHPDDLNPTKKAMERLSEGHDITRFTNRYRCKDGSWRSLSWASSSRPSQGKVYASARDVTDFLVVQDALNAREEELSITLQSIGDGVLSTDIDGRITRINAMAEHLTGWQESEAIGLAVEEVFHILNEYTRQPPVRPIMESLSTGVTRELANHTLLIARNGQERPIADSCAPIRNRSGAVVGAVVTFRDVSKERRVASELRAAHRFAKSESERLNMVLDAVVDGVIGFNAEGEVQSFNSAAERLYGYDAEEVIGRNIRMLAPFPFQDEFDDYLYNHNRTLPHRVPGIGREVTGLRKDGSSFPVELSIVETASAGEWRFTGVVRDVSERTRFIEELKAAREQADLANAAKSSFLATMSHEIRTPINGVIGMLDVLHRTSLRGYQVEMVTLIQDSAQSLLGIINDILDLSKIEAGKMSLHLAPFDVASSLESICLMMDRFAEKLHIDLTVFIDPTLPDMLWGDAQHLRQILVNLISNAVKFCSRRERQDGRVSVHAQCFKRDGNVVSIEFRVSDNGIGIDAATQAQLFAPFEQGKDSIGRQFGGTGLGLAISHNLAQLMGGSIDVKSESGIGSTFTLRLPFTADADSPLQREKSTELAGLCCLVIGRDDELAPGIAAYLAYGGATVEQAGSLLIAREWSVREPEGEWIWVIDAEGLQVTTAEIQAALRSDANSEPRFPAVLIERGKRHNLRQQGSGLFMIDGNALRRSSLLLAVSVAAGRQSLQPAQQSFSEAGRRDKINPLSREKAVACGRLILVAEDNTTNQKVIVSQLAMLGIYADVTSNGTEALQMWRRGGYPVLVTDLHMPEMDGYELTAAIRAEEADFEHIGIIALTANALRGEAEHCLKNGMDDYLCKPASLEAIALALNNWLPPLPQQPADIRSDVDTAQLTAEAPVDTRVLPALVGDDPDILRELFADFRRSSAAISQELRTAYQISDFADVSAAAHKLKSAARSIGAARLGDCCEQIEDAVKAEAFSEVEPLVAVFIQAMLEVDEYLQSC